MPKLNSKLTGAELIAQERKRQIEVEGWTPEHDSLHEFNELAGAAVCYAKYAMGYEPWAEANWPWDRKWFKPTEDPVPNLVKAGALLAAEIDRLQREKGE